MTRSGTYQPLDSLGVSGPSKGGLRLLILERALYQPSSFDIEAETFLAIQTHFNLPDDTLLAFSDEGGLSAHTLETDESNGTPTRLRMIMKAAQKYQVGNYGIAFSHDFDTGVSTGILHGTGVTSYGEDHPLWDTYAAAEMFELVKAVKSLWSHPLLLPITVMQHHLLRADYFCTVLLSNQFTDVTRQLGTTRSGRLHNTHTRNIATDLPVTQAKVNLRELTVALSSLIHENIAFCAMSDWQCSCMKHLEEILTELNQFSKAKKGSSTMRSKIRHLASSAASINRLNNAMREHGQADMNVVRCTLPLLSPKPSSHIL